MHEVIILIAKYCVAVPVLVYAYVLLKTTPEQRVRVFVRAVLAAIITAVLIKIATTLHQDARPFVRDGVHPYFSSSTDNGFPSDHTALSALLGFIVLLQRKRLGIGLLALSILIGTARVVAGVHHGQDIIGGFVIAGVGVGLAALLVRYIAPFMRKKSQETT